MIITLVLSISLIIVIVLQLLQLLHKYNKDKKKQMQTNFFRNHSEKLNSIIDMQSFRIISENSIIINWTKKNFENPLL